MEMNKIKKIKESSDLQICFDLYLIADNMKLFD